jgi:4-diphosphocytidyl-2-C-methyl-D-erythritol kinase
MEPSLTVPAFAKINLNLRVLGKRADGYHDLDTVFQTISLHDTIELDATTDSEITLSCDDRRLPADEENLVVRAARAARSSSGTNRGARIRLRKRIPAQAGLGGGSSDAAATLVALNHLWHIGSDRKHLIDLAAELGADVPFFLSGGTARGMATGIDVEPMPDVPEKFLLVLKPNANIGTADAYKLLDERSLTTSDAKTMLSTSQFTEKFGFDNAGFGALHNDFEEIAFALEPEIFRAKAALVNAGAHAALLCGSGSAVFGIFETRDAQRRAIQTIALEAGWRVFPCKTLPRAAYQSAFRHLL